MDTRELVQRIEQAFGNAIAAAADEGSFPNVLVKKESLVPVLGFCLRDPALRFDFLDGLTALDTGQDFVVIYHLLSTTFGHRLHLKVAVERHQAKLTTATGLWRAARCYEQEAAEMFGIEFEGQGPFRHLFLPDDWQGFPLRKDYVYPEEYHEIEHRRAPLRKEHVRP